MDGLFVEGELEKLEMDVARFHELREKLGLHTLAEVNRCIEFARMYHRFNSNFHDGYYSALQRCATEEQKQHLGTIQQTMFKFLHEDEG